MGAFALDASMVGEALAHPYEGVAMPDGLTADEQVRWRTMNEMEHYGPSFGGTSLLTSPFGTVIDRNPEFEEARNRNPFSSWGNFGATLNPFSARNTPASMRDRTYEEALAEDAKRQASGSRLAPLVPEDPLKRRYLQEAGIIPGGTGPQAQAAGATAPGSTPTATDSTDSGLGGGFSYAAYLRDQRRTTEATVENTRLLEELTNSLEGKAAKGASNTGRGGPIRATGGPLPVTGTTAAAVAGTPTSSTPYGPSGDGSGMGDTSRWRPLIEKQALAAGIDPDIIQGIMMMESGGNPNARNRGNGPGWRGTGTWTA
jgi:hypothetical protein